MALPALMTAGALALAGASSAQAMTPALVNPGFETGNLTGWTQTGGSSVVTTYQGTNSANVYNAPAGHSFAVTLAGCQDNILSQSFSATAGNTLSGWSFFQANDYQPFNDTGSVQLTMTGGGSSTVLFSSSVAAVGNYQGTPWTHWTYTFPSAGSYTLQATATNAGDCSLNSAVGLDLPAGPTCAVTAVRSGPPKQQDVTVTTPNGLASISNLKITNGTVVLNGSTPVPPATTVAASGPSAVLTASKTTANVRTVWSFDATDTVGQKVHCQ